MALTRHETEYVPAKTLLGYILAFLFGATVGATELVARYRDKPEAAVGSSPGLLYIGVNALASIIAFWLLFTRRLPLEANVFPGHQLLNPLLLGGFGAMVVIRTAVFNVRVGSTSVAVGPAAVLQIILNATDRETDRLRAGPRAEEVKRIMNGVTYFRAKDALPLHCFALMQNVTLEEQNQVALAIAVLDKATIRDSVKSYSLGLLLLNLVGEEVLQKAIRAIGEGIRASDPASLVVIKRAASLAEGQLRGLYLACAELSGRADEPDASGQVLTSPSDVPTGPARIAIILTRLCRRFGAEVVSDAIDIISLKGTTTVPPEEPNPLTQPKKD